MQVRDASFIICFHLYIYSLKEKIFKKVLGQLPRMKIAPNPKTNPHPNPSPKRGRQFSSEPIGMSESIVHVIQHANLQLYRSCLVGVVWKNRQMTANI